MNRNTNIFNIFAVLDNEPSPFIPSFNVYRGGSSHQISLGENTYLPHNYLDIDSTKIPKQPLTRPIATHPLHIRGWLTEVLVSDGKMMMENLADAKDSLYFKQKNLA